MLLHISPSPHSCALIWSVHLSRAGDRADGADIDDAVGADIAVARARDVAPYLSFTMLKSSHTQKVEKTTAYKGHHAQGSCFHRVSTQRH